jgi:hypothetical protein
MHIRDERVLNFIYQRAGAKGVQIRHEDIADFIQCHRNTAMAIVHRLELARLIRIDRTAKRGGYVYQIAR